MNDTSRCGRDVNGSDEQMCGGPEGNYKTVVMDSLPAGQRSCYLFTATDRYVQ